MSLIDEFMKRTGGDPVEKRVKLREFIFRQNTGRWPSHLGDRRWFEGTLPCRTWRGIDEA